eukprot:TRINITY_DN3920_c0_g1_i1.p1 TRINITY_DN3920_c0_g1~~TRINITY_DN3920_c0_g1_i1.p1  ORF type:complete len:344 (-),score=59.91 TRINITY_DN3920_c0_g1_i1:328-1359(-)
MDYQPTQQDDGGNKPTQEWEEVLNPHQFQQHFVGLAQDDARRYMQGVQMPPMAPNYGFPTMPQPVNNMSNLNPALMNGPTAQQYYAAMGQLPPQMEMSQIDERALSSFRALSLQAGQGMQMNAFNRQSSTPPRQHATSPGGGRRSVSPNNHRSVSPLNRRGQSPRRFMITAAATRGLPNRPQLVSHFTEMMTMCGEDINLLTQVFFDIAFERRLLDPNNLEGIPVRVEVSKHNPTQEFKRYCRDIYYANPDGIKSRPPSNSSPKAMFVSWAKENNIDMSLFKTRKYRRSSGTSPTPARQRASVSENSADSPKSSSAAHKLEPTPFNRTSDPSPLKRRRTDGDD